MKHYTTVEELLEDVKIHGPYVIKNGGHIYSLITSVHKVSPTCIGVVLDGIHCAPIYVNDLVQYYTWQDGSPCGKNED
jgi:hypothetical protein